MNLAASILLSLLVMSTTGLVMWLWLAALRVERELSALHGFEGMHLEVGNTD